jgi:hypothetical protein
MCRPHGMLKVQHSTLILHKFQHLALKHRQLQREQIKVINMIFLYTQRENKKGLNLYK